MPFVKMPGLKGKIYVPEDQPEGMKKHPCKECFSCQMCPDTRCSICREGKASKNSCLCTEKPSQ